MLFSGAWLSMSLWTPNNNPVSRNGEHNNSILNNNSHNSNTFSQTNMVVHEEDEFYWSRTAKRNEELMKAKSCSIVTPPVSKTRMSMKQPKLGGDDEDKSTDPLES